MWNIEWKVMIISQLVISQKLTQLLFGYLEVIITFALKLFTDYEKIQ